MRGGSSVAALRNWRLGLRRNCRSSSAFALTELRTVLRSPRVWVAFGIVGPVTLAAFGVVSYVHGIHSVYTPVAGYLGPRYFLSNCGVPLVGVVLLVPIVLTFDVVAADERARMSDALWTRTFTNGALVAGRFAAVCLVCWTLFAVCVGAVCLIGWAARSFDWWLGDVPVSAAAFLLVDAAPAMIAWCGGLMLLATAFGRGAAVAVPTVVLAAIAAGGASLPGYLAAVVVPVSVALPTLSDAELAVHRGSLLAVGTGLLLVAAALHPRPDRSVRRGRFILIGTGTAALGVCGIAAVAVWEWGRMERRDQFRTVHEAVAAASAGARQDLVELRGRVRIEPGKRLEVHAEMRVTAHADVAELVFSFNPGMRIRSLSLDGRPATFEHLDGLLTVGLPEPAARDRAVVLALNAAGLPDFDFAYLDSAVDWRRVPSGLLGRDASVFDAGYVALMPGMRWLPSPGANLDVDGGGGRDFFLAEIAVQVPPGWLVAAPGHRTDRGNGRFLFRPDGAVSEVALIASDFDRRALSAPDLEIELLLMRGHQENADDFGESADVLAAQVAEVGNELERAGIPYPHRRLSIVETPRNLRAYGGGRRMDSVLAPTGMLLLNQATFATARFEALLRRVAEAFPDREDAAYVKTGLLVEYSRADKLGDLLKGYARHLFFSRTSATGEGAAAVNRLCLELANQLMPRPFAPRSTGVHSFDVELNLPALMVIGAAGPAGEPFAELAGNADSPPVWEAAALHAVARLEALRNPGLEQAVLALRTNAVARAVVDAYGRPKVAALLARLGDRFANATFTAAEFSAAARNVGAPIEPLVGDWIRAVGMPGFAASPARVDRVADGSDGQPRYRMRVAVGNGEAVPGLAYLSVDRFGLTERTPPRLIEPGATVELELVSERVPTTLWLGSYLSLNRGAIPVRLPPSTGADGGRVRADNANDADERDRRMGHPVGALDIVIDDLDPGFAVERADPPAWWRFRGVGAPLGTVLDRGLPRYTWSTPVEPGRWYREAVPTGWGKYRRTVVRATGGEGHRSAVFTASLPNPGRWGLDFHIPTRPYPDFPENPPGPMHLDALGAMDAELRDGTRRTAIRFDGGAAEPGWNRLGVFDLTSRRIGLAVSNRSTGLVVVDAIRWRPVKS